MVATDPELLHHNRASLAELQTLLRRDQGGFSLTWAACDYRYLRRVIIDTCQKAAPHPLTILHLSPRTPNLLATIQAHLGETIPPALMVTGLEEVSGLPDLLRGANLGRDAWPKALPCPVILWVTEAVRQQVIQNAPDLRSFSPSAIPFTLPIPALGAALEQGTHALFQTILDGQPPPAPPGVLQLQGSEELESALEALAATGWAPHPDLAASLDFLRGREAHGRLDFDSARQCYQRSLAYWRSPWVRHRRPANALSPRDREAVLLLFLGLWCRSCSLLQPAQYGELLREARQYFSEALAIFREGDQLGRLARFLPMVAEVMQKQRDWQGLEQVAVEGVTLHRLTQDPLRLARDRGFLAEVALMKEDWPTAYSEASAALALLDQGEGQSSAIGEDGPWLVGAIAPEPEAQGIANRFQRGWYRYLLGQALRHLQGIPAALPHLHLARLETNPSFDLTLHCQVLETLMAYYFEQGEYGRAFAEKQALRSVEYRFQRRAFIGAEVLQPHGPPAPRSKPRRLAPAAEIEASGRWVDVQALLKRLQDPQQQIVVIHGPSGVGKSSILTAGLIPALHTLYPEGRTTLPVLVQTYRDWPQGVKRALDQALEPWVETLGSRPEGLGLLGHGLEEGLQGLRDRLTWGLEKNCFFVLIFDQFEDFFFEETSAQARRHFYGFLHHCINTPWVNVVLALREDYLHRLLEMERTFDQLGSLGDLGREGLLGRSVRYPLGNFPPAAAAAIIGKLTTAAQFPLEEALIQRLVADLAAPHGEVRPIELQVVGAQLQRRRIDTLAQYESLGPFPKAALVQGFLTAVVEDCGPPNESLAWMVLYLLTDEDRDNRPYRPLRTQEEIAHELTLRRVATTPEQLSLVLTILVGSGLVFEVPEEPEVRYQLVHDYLVSPVRQRPPAFPPPGQLGSILGD